MSLVGFSDRQRQGAIFLLTAQMVRLGQCCDCDCDCELAWLPPALSQRESRHSSQVGPQWPPCMVQFGHAQLQTGPWTPEALAARAKCVEWPNYPDTLRVALGELSCWLALQPTAAFPRLEQWVGFRAKISAGASQRSGLLQSDAARQSRGSALPGKCQVSKAKPGKGRGHVSSMHPIHVAPRTSQLRIWESSVGPLAWRWRNPTFRVSVLG
jgi:hypothetical protein